MNYLCHKNPKQHKCKHKNEVKQVSSIKVPCHKLPINKRPIEVCIAFCLCLSYSPQWFQIGWSPLLETVSLDSYDTVSSAPLNIAFTTLLCTLDTCSGLSMLCSLDLCIDCHLLCTQITWIYPYINIVQQCATHWPHVHLARASSVTSKWQARANLFC